MDEPEEKPKVKASKIVKGVPLPPGLNEGRPLRGGHKPIYPFRDMEAGDYMEVEIINHYQRQKILLHIRNTRKSRPKWKFVWKYGLSEFEQNENNGKAYVKIWRTK